MKKKYEFLEMKILKESVYFFKSQVGTHERCISIDMSVNQYFYSRELKCNVNITY